MDLKLRSLLAKCPSISSHYYTREVRLLLYFPIAAIVSYPSGRAQTLSFYRLSDLIGHSRGALSTVETSHKTLSVFQQPKRIVGYRGTAVKQHFWTVDQLNDRVKIRKELDIVPCQ
ncbi:hypothetical protein SLA2020_354290 [Shorea laevis]